VNDFLYIILIIAIDTLCVPVINFFLNSIIVYIKPFLCLKILCTFALQRSCNDMLEAHQTCALLSANCASTKKIDEVSKFFDPGGFISVFHA
jgi:hypothetical protein